MTCDQCQPELCDAESDGLTDEAGFTLVELVVTMAVMSIVATAMMAVRCGRSRRRSTITNRRDVLTDGRIAIDQMTKQLRQGESVDLTRATRRPEVQRLHRRYTRPRSSGA
jgi:prepilin-type N-terminal cleavage/methylation domain-containing protein